MSVTLKSIEDAAQTLDSVVRKTPLEISKRLSEKYNCNVYLKREDLQEVRSFKIRGAYNKIANLSNEEKQKGVTCASAGNHAQGVAYACNDMKIKGTIFMPVVTPNQKIERVVKFGNGYVDVRLEGDTYDDAKARSKKFSEETGAVNVHAFDDDDVISGQGTIGKEIFEQLEGKVDYVFIAVGGGGLISGVGKYLKSKNEHVHVIGVEEETQASMHESIRNNEITTLPKINTFVDGTAVKTPGSNTFKIVKEVVEDIVVVPEGQVASDMISLYQNEGVIAEPAGALCLGGLESKKEKLKGKNVVCIICGGNNDILRYPEVLEKSLVYKGLKHYFILNFAQKPGQLKLFVNDALGPNDDIVRFEYIKKTNKEMGPALVGIELKVKEDYQKLTERMDRLGFDYKIISSDDMLYNYLV